MKIVVLICRLLMGLMFFVFGLNGFLMFMKGELPPGQANDFMNIFMKSHYVWVVAGVQVIAGVLFLANRYVPLALVLIGPVIVNILVFHVLLMPQGIAIGLVVTVMWFVVFFSVRPAFDGIFQAKA